MRRIAIALAVALAAPSVAQARVHKIAPPGNSGVGQYLETVPTADGGQPTNTVHPGGVGVAGGRGGTGGGPGSTGGGAIAASTQRALAKHGPTGDATAALAAATAPRRARRRWRLCRCPTGIECADIGRPRIIAVSERPQGAERFDRWGRARSIAADRPDRQRARGGGPDARAPAPHRLSKPAECASERSSSPCYFSYWVQAPTTRARGA